VTIVISMAVTLAKAVGGPGSTGFLILSTSAGALAAYAGGRARHLAKIWLLLVFAGYLAAALPVVSRSAVDGLPGYSAGRGEQAATQTDMLFVLSGDNARGRARQTRAVLNTVGPRCVIVSGGPQFVRTVLEAGVAPEGLIVDATATTTRAQIDTLAGWANRCGAQRVVLVASALSMPRIAALVRTTPIPVVLLPSPLDDDLPGAGIGLNIPSRAALHVSRDALYEHAALAYYRYRGWIS
jgi:uncharacterized SAM-binding protein YcdF (DUF218 family)